MPPKKLQIPIKECAGILLGQDRYLTISEMAHKLRKCEETIRRWVKAGKLPKPTDAGLFKEVDVIEYMTRVS